MDHNQVEEYKDPRDYKSEAVQEFLKKIAELESDSGQNMNHREMKHGMHSGTSAVGEYGIMPVTARDLDKQYNINQLEDLDNAEVQERLKNDPELRQRIAETLASKLLNKVPSETAAHMWQFGHNKVPSEEKLEQSPRVRKFRVLNEK